MSDRIAANDGQVTEWGRFIDEDQLDELRDLSRALALGADMLDGGGPPPGRVRVAAMFRVFYERLEDILAEDMPIIALEIEDDGRPGTASVT